MIDITETNLLQFYFPHFSHVAMDTETSIATNNLICSDDVIEYELDGDYVNDTDGELTVKQSRSDLDRGRLFTSQSKLLRTNRSSYILTEFCKLKNF